MEYILAYDFGTSGVKAALVDLEGRMIGSKESGYPLIYTEEGYVEQEPAAYWKAVCEATRDVVESTPAKLALHYLSADGEEHYPGNLDVTVTYTLTDEEAAAYTYEAVMGGADGWNPRKLMEKVAAPAGLKYDAAAEMLTWQPSEYAICYVVIDGNDNVIGFTTDTKYSEGLAGGATYIDPLPGQTVPDEIKDQIGMRR